MPYTLETVEKRLADNIPSLSPTAAKVMQLANNMNCPPAELTRVIKLDPVLSAKVLKLVNSSYFSLSTKVASLEKAVILVGLNTIKNLALSAAVLAQTTAKGQARVFSIESFWKHSLAVGVTAKFIALKRDVPKKVVEDYFVAGMMHQLGLLVEGQLYPEEMQRILLTAEALGLLAVEEAELHGLNHCRIGKMLGERWGLSSDLVEVLEHYRNPPPELEHKELVLTVYLAYTICTNNEVGLVVDDIPIDVDPVVYEALGLSPEIEEEVMAVMEDEIRKATEFLRA
jgi:HD-like signal output (HDOD) protein